MLYITFTCCNNNKQYSVSFLELEEKYGKETEAKERAYEKKLEKKEGRDGLVNERKHCSYW